MISFPLLRLSSYISLYDFKMSREEHVGLVRLLWSLMVIKDMEPRIIYICIRLPESSNQKLFFIHQFVSGASWIC